MRYLALLISSFFLVSCAGNTHLRRVVHEAPTLLIELDQVKIAASPDFPAPYDHPFNISADALQDILQSLEVVPGGGFFKMIFSGKDKQSKIFDAKDMKRVSIQLAKALSEASSGEKVHFYYSVPKDTSKVLVSAGMLVFKDERLHLRLNYYRIPMRKGSRMRSAEQGILRSEKGRYTFTLFEDNFRQHRRYKNSFGFEGTDDHWLVIDYQGIANEASIQKKEGLPAERLLAFRTKINP